MKNQLKGFRCKSCCKVFMAGFDIEKPYDDDVKTYIRKGLKLESITENISDIKDWCSCKNIYGKKK